MRRAWAHRIFVYLGGVSAIGTVVALVRGGLHGTAAGWCGGIVVSLAGQWMARYGGDPQ